MNSFNYTLWSLGNLTLAPFILILFTASTVTIPLLFQEGVWPIALLLIVVLPIGTALWPLWIFAEGMTSVALARKAKTTDTRLAVLAWDRYGPSIVLETSDPAARRWHSLGLAMLKPGWWGYAAAVLQTASAGLAIASATFWQWPMWASASFLVPWAAGWLWYSKSVSARRYSGTHV